MKIIVNVDDLGLHQAVQRAVEDCVRLGTISSSTLMANGPCVLQALSLNGKVGLGAHLNILRGRPILSGDRLQSVVGPDGLFLGDYSSLLRKYYFNSINLSEVEAEWKTQVAFLLDSGFQLDHLDSEKHIHCWPAMMNIACRIAKYYGIRWVRRTQESPFMERIDKASCRSRLLWLWSLSHKPCLDVSWPHAVWGVADQASDCTADRFLGWVKQQDKNVQIVEICCHPGKRLAGDPDVSPDYGKLRVPHQWQTEYDLLTGTDWQHLFRKIGSPVAYGSL